MMKEFLRSAMFVAGMVSLFGCSAGNKAIVQDVAVLNLQQDFDQILREKSRAIDWEKGAVAANAPTCAALYNWEELKEFGSKLSKYGLSFGKIDRQVPFLRERRERALALASGVTSSETLNCGGKNRHEELVRVALDAIDGAPLTPEEWGSWHPKLRKVLIREMAANSKEALMKIWVDGISSDKYSSSVGDLVLKERVTHQELGLSVDEFDSVFSSIKR